MSNRDSLGLGFGDLLPQDVVEIFAQEKHGKRGRKKRSHSLGRAFGWLKGRKKKYVGSNGQDPGLGPALDLALDGHPAGHQGGHKGAHKSGKQAHQHSNSHGPNRDDDKAPAPPSIQENVFIESSRPKYLEDLHTEALEGLKMIQQEESNNGTEFKDDVSTASLASVQMDSDASGFMSDSTIADTSSVVSVQSSVSTKSSRSGLTRQGSTFRPLNSEKPEKTKTRRRHRKTVAGIPQHVQREMGLDRMGWTATSAVDEEQLLNGKNENTTTDGPQEATGAASSPQNVGIIHPLSKEHIEQLSAAHAGHRDDLALLPNLGPDASEGDRPWSVAVPGLTTASSLQHEPPSPVMSISPQASYLSKIIQGAVLPPSVDVVEISRGRSRNSVRTVSKSSLLIASPVSSRASSRASSSKASTVNAASNRATPNVSDSSGWSNSDSSETLVSDSSTMSSSSTPKLKTSQSGNASAKEDNVSVHSSNSKVPANGKVIGNEGATARSLSVMKPKKAPPPPNRSYSLHNKMKRRSRDLAEVRVISGEASLSASGVESDQNKPGSTPSSPGYHADTSSLEDSADSPSVSPVKSQLPHSAKVEDSVAKDGSPEKQKHLQENKLNKIISPSSGYSSQDGTSPQHSKHASSPRYKKGILAKLQRLFPGSSPSGSAPRALTEISENTKPAGHLKSQSIPSVDTVSMSPSVRALRELFNIPPPPKIHAPPPPPPEVWAHNKRTFELLLGPPAPDMTYVVIKKNPKDRRQQRHAPSASTEGSVKSCLEERNQKVFPAESSNGSLHVLGVKKVEESEILNVESRKESSERLAHVEQSVSVKGNGKVTETTEKMKVSEMFSGMLVKAVEKRHEKLAAMKEEAKTSATNMDPVSAISLVRISPSVTPPPTHHPPQPPAKQTTYVGVTPAANQVPTSPEASWPLPPPPMAQTSVTIVSGHDETDLPFPPPPVFSAEKLVLRSDVTTRGPAVLQESCFAVAKEEKTTQDKCAASSASEKVDGALQITAPTPLNIPPPPPYAAPPPPSAAPHPPSQSATPPLVFAPLLINVSPPPPPPPPAPKNVCLPAPKEVSPLPPKDISPLSPIESFPPPPKEFSPSSPKEVSLSLTEIFPLPPKEFCLSPRKEFSPVPSIEVSREVSPTPIKVQEVSPHPMKDSAPILVVEVPPQVPPHPVKDSAPILVVEVPPQVPPHPVKDSAPILVVEVPPQVPPHPVKDSAPISVVEVSLLPRIEVSGVPIEQDALPSFQANACSPSEKAPPVVVAIPSLLQSISSPPRQEPAPPPPQLETHSSDKKSEDIPVISETVPLPCNSVIYPPKSIPPPPPLELLPQTLALNTGGTASHDVSPSSHSEDELDVASIPLYVPHPRSGPAQVSAFVKRQASPTSTENQSQESDSVSVRQEQPRITPSLLQMVKLRSSGSPDPIQAQSQAQPEVTTSTLQANNEVQTQSSSGEAPQKPIRRSLIMTSPTPFSPPATVMSQSTLPKTDSTVVPPESSPTAVSPTKKSPPPGTVTQSMKLQEAIRLRTAARSKDGPPTLISLHSPTSPLSGDLHKSPTSTASFIFSKSNRKVVIETKPYGEAVANLKNQPAAVASATKTQIEAELLKKGVKVPPPVAKKPLAKTKEIETSAGTEQTAGQEAQPESIDCTAQPNGTAGTVEGQQTPST